MRFRKAIARVRIERTGGPPSAWETMSVWGVDAALCNALGDLINVGWIPDWARGVDRRIVP